MNTLAVTPMTESTPNRATPNQDALLQVSRRVDWRFLLPDPDLGHTAYVGRTDAGLIESLRRFTSSLTILERGQAVAATTSHFALVIASNPNRNELRQAAELTRVGGFLYFEVDKRWSRQTRHRLSRDNRPPRGVRGYLSAIQQLDLSDPKVHWHWPSFDSCHEMIPLQDRAAGICALRRRGSSSRVRWKTRLARLLLETQLLANFVPCFSVITRRCS